MKLILLLAILSLGLCGCNGQVTPATEATTAPPTEPETQTETVPALADDGYPTGHGSPEGVACDLARAFINGDSSLFSTICIEPNEAARAEYATFLDELNESLDSEATREVREPRRPKSIERLYAARRPSRDAPNYGYGTAEFLKPMFVDVMFVDVRVFLRNGETALSRTYVVQDENEKWYVHSAPLFYPSFSFGLNDETVSTELYSAPK